MNNIFWMIVSLVCGGIAVYNGFKLYYLNKFSKEFDLAQENQDFHEMEIILDKYKKWFPQSMTDSYQNLIYAIRDSVNIDNFCMEMDWAIKTRNNDIIKLVLDKYQGLVDEEIIVEYKELFFENKEV